MANWSQTGHCRLIQSLLSFNYFPFLVKSIDFLLIKNIIKHNGKFLKQLFCQLQHDRLKNWQNLKLPSNRKWEQRERNNININLVPRVLSYSSLRIERERPWEILVGARWSRGARKKIDSEGGVFSMFTQWSQEQDRFANPTTTVTETKGHFCLNRTISRLKGQLLEEESKTRVVTG